MENARATVIFDCLSSGLRLDLFRLLVREGHNGLVAGEISSALEVAPSNLSFHLKALVHAGLISVEQEGRYQRFRANIPLMQELVLFLTDACCAGHPDECAETRAGPTCPPEEVPPTVHRKRSA
jgi:ArsR family transcriptional regulator, arsenate/arsenite/antimonite-responsive transcriptional repressor